MYTHNTKHQKYKYDFLSQYLSICVYMYLSIIYLSIFSPIILTIYISIYLSSYQSIYISINLSIYPSFDLSIHLSIYLSIYLSLSCLAAPTPMNISIRHLAVSCIENQSLLILIITLNGLMIIIHYQT